MFILSFGISLRKNLFNIILKNGPSLLKGENQANNLKKKRNGCNVETVTELQYDHMIHFNDINSIVFCACFS